ncbi:MULTISPECIES: MarR family winged helix-turn-helix transcriptional regulator [unclassified Cetobacterium]|uniref:MarR family winged helix-turn-helix transcriptional regulator n=1 Tax=unclassified Cetobacterium TaxID=2630983 RepID=UPI000648C2C0|nr:MULTISPECIES: MarR family transcriptional regulator [unclassified Cetobacterium]
MKNNLAALISKLNRYQKKYLNHHLKDTDLEASQAIILLKIKENSEITPKEIFEMGIVEKPSVSKILKKLEDMNFIEKNSSNKDGRSYSVSLTEDGLKMCSFIDSIINELNIVYEKIASKFLSEDLMKILNEVYNEK